MMMFFFLYLLLFTHFDATFRPACNTTSLQLVTVVVSLVSSTEQDWGHLVANLGTCWESDFQERLKFSIFICFTNLTIFAFINKNKSKHDRLLPWYDEFGGCKCLFFIHTKWVFCTQATKPWIVFCLIYLKHKKASFITLPNLVNYFPGS